MSCVLFINNFEHYFLQGSLVLNKKLMKKYCKLVSLLSIKLEWVTECKVWTWKWHSVFVITSPLTVKQIKLQELSLGDVHSFCLYLFYMNDCISMYKLMSSHMFCMTIIIFLIQNVKILSVFTNVLFIRGNIQGDLFPFFWPPSLRLLLFNSNVVSWVLFRCKLLGKFIHFLLYWHGD